MDKLVELRSAADISRLEGAWRDLAKRAAPHSMPQTYEYALAALERAQNASARSFLAVAEEGGDAIGIWGFTLSRRSLHRTLEPFSNGSHEEFSAPLADARMEVEATERLLRLVATIRADRAMLYNIDPDGAVAAASSRLGLRRGDWKTDGLAIPAGKYPTWTAVEKMLSKGDRTDLRRCTRRLDELEPARKLRLRWRGTPEECNEAIDFFIERKTRWAREHNKRALWLGDPGGLALFFKRLCRLVDLAETPVIATADFGDAPIAAALCLVGPFRVEFAFTTYDGDFAKYGPGKLLLKYLVDWSLTRGRDFGFGIMTADYKEEWPVERRTYASRTIALTPLGLVPAPREVIRGLRFMLGPYKRRLFAWTRALSRGGRPAGRL
jgi:CelD/BcsL family acetyltransferase involved in cellulose biosynthesis